MRRSAWLGVLVAVVASLAPAAPAQAAAPPLPNSMASTGDSITRAFDVSPACLLHDCPRYSWSTGGSSDVSSHYRRILARNPAISGHAFNDAKSGANMADLDRQLQLAGSQQVEYATVLMGANDLCTSSSATMTPTAVFQSQLDQALSHFYAADPGAHVYLSSIPNIYQLWSILHTNPSARLKWSTFHICQSMLSRSNTEAQRQLVVAQEQADNQVLATECAMFTAQGRDCHWDGLAGYNFQFTTADVSTIDYFHPNLTGQNAIAQVTWAAGYWPGV